MTDIGTLIVVILKARNLPNKRQFGKQDPYCVVVLNGESRKTKIIRRGGQHPEWDEEIRFTIYEDTDALSASDDGSPPPLPPKAGRGPKKIQGGEKMALACFAADKEPELIGETMVDLNEALTKGETDEWFTLRHKDKYCGEVYLELTFWSNEPRPEKKATPKFAKVNRQYGGPGVFVPSEESPGHHQQGSGSSHDSHRRDSFSSSVIPSNSSMGLELYKPAYEQTVRGHAPHSTSVDELVNDMGELVYDQRRRDTFPPMQSGFSSRSVSTSEHSAALSSSSLAFPVSESPSRDTSIANSPHRAVTPSGQRQHRYSLASPSHDDNSSASSPNRAVTPSGQRPHRYSLASSQSYDITQYQPAYEPSPPPRSVYHTPPRHGPRYSMPAASSGFIPVSSKFGPASHSVRTLASYGSESSGLAPPPTNASTTVPGYTPTPALTPAPASFTPGPQVTPASTLPPASTSPGSFLSTQQTLNVPQAGYSPPVSAPPASHLPAPPLPMFPGPSQSAPPQVHQSLVQPVSGQPLEYITTSAPVPQATNRVVSNHVPGSRPLPPQPQQARQRVPSSTPIPANQAYNHAIGALALPYAQNQLRPPTSDPGPPPVQQNPLPVPPGPPGPLGPGSHTPSNTSNNVVPTGSPYHHTPSPSPQPSPSQQSPALRMLDGTSPSNGSLPPSPVPPRAAHPRSVSGRPSLPLPPAPPLPAAGSYQQLPFPQLPIPPAPLPSSQSQQQYLTSSPSSVMQAGQSFHPGPPPRPPTQISDPLQPSSYRQVAH